MRRDAGFTILEVLVALAILALSLIALYRALGSAYSGARRVGLQDEAMAVGQSQIARVGNDLALGPGKLEGKLSRGYTWRLVVEDITAARSSLLFRRYAVTYEALDPFGAPLFQLRTFRIARAGLP